MTVARILKEKGGDVLTTQPHRTMKEASRCSPARASAPSSSRTPRTCSAFSRSATSFARSAPGGAGALEDRFRGT